MGENVARTVYAVGEGDLFLFFSIQRHVYSHVFIILYFFLIRRRADVMKILISIKRFRNI